MTMKLQGADALLKDLKAFGPSVSQKAAKTGVRKAAQYLRREFKREAPRVSGTLRKSIKLKMGRDGKAWVGLRERYYYKTLEFGRKGGPPLHPFFERVWNQHRGQAAQMIVDETRKAVYVEAGKVYARSRTRRRK